MIDFKLDENQDVIIDHDIQTVADNEELLQKIATTLRTRLGEFEPDPEMGLEDSNLYGKQVRTDYLETDILDAISQQVGDEVVITGIEMGEADENRSLVISMDITFPNSESQNFSIDISRGGDM